MRQSGGKDLWGNNIHKRKYGEVEVGEENEQRGCKSDKVSASPREEDLKDGRCGIS